jgi:hypothetical protein
VVRSISKEHLRRLLHNMGITAQRTRTWKWSNDPLYEEKKQWVLGAYKADVPGMLGLIGRGFEPRRICSNRARRTRCCPTSSPRTFPSDLGQDSNERTRVRSAGPGAHW